jgi:hypothetical protein
MCRTHLRIWSALSNDSLLADRHVVLEDIHRKLQDYDEARAIDANTSYRHLACCPLTRIDASRGKDHAVLYEALTTDSAAVAKISNLVID